MAIFKVFLVALLLAQLSQPIMAEELFGFTAQPQKSLADLPQWQRVLKRENAPVCRNPLGVTCRPDEWNLIIAALQNEPPLVQLQKINQHFNRKPYTLDRFNYGQEDYWATVEEFLSRSGDCEDYAIAKYFALRELGFPTEKMRILVLQDTNLRIGHAVLTVNWEGDYLILDNQTEEVLSHREIYHYVPLFSVNERGWWLHIPNFSNS